MAGKEFSKFQIPSVKDIAFFDQRRVRCELIPRLLFNKREVQSQLDKLTERVKCKEV